MKIYNVKILRDINSSYNGLDDVSVYSFHKLKDAENKLQKEFELAQKELLRDEKDISLLNTDKDSTYFEVNDGVNYIKGEVVETELDLDIYAVTEVKTDPYEAANISTTFKSSREDAYLKYENIKTDLYNDKLEEFDAEEDDDESSEDKLKNFISEHVRHDYEFMNGNKYFHVVHCGGEELIITIDKLELEND